MAHRAPSLSRSAEDYLKAIYCIGEPEEAASTSAIAEALRVQPASVTGMVKRMAESGLLEHLPYRGVRLTPKGTLAALRVLRRHRVLETYLTEKLGYAWEDVHDEAERLEHAASDGLIERMAEALGNPRHDPHGAPIPTPTGEIEATGPGTLWEMRPEEEGRVRAVRDDDSRALQEAEAAGLLPGSDFRVVDANRPDGPITIQVEGEASEETEVRARVARRVFVQLTSRSEPSETSAQPDPSPAAGAPKGPDTPRSPGEEG